MVWPRIYQPYGKALMLCAIVIAAAGLLLPRPVAQAGTGLIATRGAGGQATNFWGTPANAQGTADDNTYATASPAINAKVGGVWNAYNFDTSLPLHAAITKVEIIAQYKVDNAIGTSSSMELQAAVNGVNCAAVIDSSQPTTDTDFTANMTSCRSWTRANLMDSQFSVVATAARGNTLIGANFTMDYVQVRVTYNTPDYEQAAYRWYDNANSTAAGTALASQDTAPTLYAPRDRVRLRLLLHVSTTSLVTSSEQFKLQFAQKGASCSGLSYADVTASSAIAYYDNPAPANNAALTSGGTDPQHSTHTTISQAYNEASPFSTLANVAAGQDGMWDISLVGNGALANTAYCFRMVKNDSTLLSTYTVYPEIVTSPAGSLVADIVDAGGSSVASPSFGFSSLLSPHDCTNSTATFGVDSQRVRIKNTTDTPGWSLSIAATGGSTALWSAGTPKYDFNDGAGSPAGCAAGLDSDTYGGQMTINPSSGSISPRSVSACTTTGISKGSSAAFAEGTLNAITLVSGSASANTGCFWDITGISVAQQIPGGQGTGSYSISLTMTVVAN